MKTGQPSVTLTLVLDALEMAIGRRQPESGLLHHSDSNTERCQVFQG